ncbi:MAG: M14 family zinc carboxypeptidase [Planctomycetota bacterium]|nr:M14 family zinc carboxypeptidase [Planctomycetota bacterium]
MRASKTLFPLILLATALAAPAPCATPQTAAPFEPIHFGDADDFAYDTEFFPGATYDANVLDPAHLLGQPVGSRLARHHEIVALFEAWAEASDRMSLSEYGRTYEGRPLLRVVISSPANLARMAELEQAARRLADPRDLDEDAADELLEGMPAVAWIGYSVHGDELSGADSSLALAYHFVASRDEDVAAMLEDLVIVMDPAMNPDGRMRILSQIEQSFGYVQNLDYASMHRGRWPGGRGNHYLFDMNRDWMTGIAPETRGRWAAARQLPPQLFIDAHEMDGLDTFLFYPQARPHSPEYSEHVQHWQDRLANEAGAAFDAHRWGYYTREWADAWYPAYSDFWGSLQGAIGMLYEQASSDGQALLRESGEVVTYRESVHGQVVAAMANLTTLVDNRAAVLAGYLAERRKNVSAEQPEADRMFVARPDGTGRLARFVETLVSQGVEVERTYGETTVTGVVDTFGRTHDELVLPSGSALVRVRQPQAPMVRAYLGFDPRMSVAGLEEERRQLEAGKGSKMYDVTAWDLGRAFDLDCYWADAAAAKTSLVSPGSDPWVHAARELTGLRGMAGGSKFLGSLFPVGDERSYLGPTAFVVDGTSDRASLFAVEALRRGIVLHLATEAFSANGKRFPPGSLLLRLHENEGPDFDVLEFLGDLGEAVQRSGVETHALTTLRSPDEGPDLGGGAFELLAAPRVAIVSGDGVAQSEFGHLWRFIDEELRLKASLLEASSLGRYDLRRFNVLVLPSGAGRAALRSSSALAEWVEAGGTLIAVGSSAGSLAGSDLSDVVLRRDALEELEDYAWLVERERAARTATVDLEALYDGVKDLGVGEGSEQGESPEGPASFLDDAPDLERGDAWMRRFSPSGVILRAERDPEHWLNGGARADELPVFFEGSRVFLAPAGVAVPVRLGERGDLRLGGLLWPEAEERIADSAWATVEGRGAGQVILFASSPVFRGYWHGTARLLANALILGPGAGADQPMGL